MSAFQPATSNQIEELNNASIHQLSLKAAIFDVSFNIQYYSSNSVLLIVLAA